MIWRIAICRAGALQGRKNCCADCPLYRFKEYKDREEFCDWQKCESGVVIHRFEVEDVIKEIEKTEPWKTYLDKVFRDEYTRPLFGNVGGELTFELGTKDRK